MTDDRRLTEDYVPLQAIKRGCLRGEVRAQGTYLGAAPVVGAAAARGVPGGRKLENDVMEPLRQAGLIQ